MKENSISSLDTLKVRSFLETSTDICIIVLKTDEFYFAVSGNFKSVFEKDDIVYPNEVLLSCEIGELLSFKLFDIDTKNLNPIGVLFVLD